MAIKFVNTRTLSRECQKIVRGIRKGETYVITKYGKPVACLQALPDAVALRVLPLGHPRVEKILSSIASSEGDIPAGPLLEKLRRALNAVKARGRTKAPSR